MIFRKELGWDSIYITKVWPHFEVPPITVGKMVLNRNPVNYFAEVEQAAFCPGNPPGNPPVRQFRDSHFSDKMLQARVLAYHNTHFIAFGHSHLTPPPQLQGEVFTFCLCS